MKLNRKHRRYQPFTLIEIMIVVVIIGMIASLAVPAIMDKLEQAKVETTRANLQTLSAAVDSYYMDNNEYPNSLSDLLHAPNNRSYLKDRSLPKDGWGQDFYYTVGGDKNYDIISYGADKQSGGTDFNEDLSCFGKAE